MSSSAKNWTAVDSLLPLDAGYSISGDERHVSTGWVMFRKELREWIPS
jgi:hypothetical protein